MKFTKINRGIAMAVCLSLSLALSACGGSKSASVPASSGTPTDAEYQKAWKAGIAFGATAGSLNGALLAVNNLPVYSKFSANPDFTLLGLEVSFHFDSANPNPCGQGGQAGYPDSTALSLAFEGGCFVGFGYPLKQHTE